MKLNNTKFLLSMIMLTVSFISIAQDPGDPDGGGDQPAAPINNYVIFLALLGVFFAYKFLRKSLVKAK